MNQVETIGVDLGGTKLAVGVIGDGPEAVFSNEVSSGGYSQEAVVDLLAGQIGEAREAHPGAAAAGVGIPATMDFEAGHAISTVNLDLADLPVRDMLTERLGMPVVIDNDANTAMLAEAVYGAARGSRHALMLTLGTGIGGGIWLDGEIFRGVRGAGAELGHVVVEIDGPRCQGNCPGYGCVETFASGTAIGRQGREAAQREPESALGLLAAAGQEITAREVASAARGGDRAASGVIERVGHYLGTALVSLVNIFEPEVIVLGGGVMRMGDLLLDPVRRELRQRALPPMNRTEVVAAELGPDAGMIGAAALARIELEKRT
ncbi:MAG: ROK family protein [Solirubrobacterales bacterium]|nr:ROK family protein [Solirubrobacterales bacterium]